MLRDDPVPDDVPGTPRLSHSFVDAKGSYIKLVFNENLKNWKSRYSNDYGDVTQDDRWINVDMHRFEPSPDLFTVTASGAGGVVSVDYINAKRNEVILGISGRLTNDAEVYVRYDPRGASDRTVVMQDWAGNEVAAFTQVPVTNYTHLPERAVSTRPGPVRAYVGSDATAMVIEFDRDVSSTTFPDKAAFTATIDGEDVEVIAAYQATTNTKWVSLELNTSARRGLPTTVTYTKPASGNKLQGTNSVEVNSFGPFIVHDTVVGFRVFTRPMALTVTEGTDAAAEVSVVLEPAPTAAVMVDYATEDDTATAPADYTHTSGTLTFSPGETLKTVSVPIVDDDVEDAGDVFIIRLSNGRGGPDGAFFEHTGSARVTIQNHEAVIPLTAELTDVPGSHGGNAFTVDLRFSEAFKVGYATIRDDALTVTGGNITGVRRADNPHDERQGLQANQGWRVTIQPTGDDDVAIALPVTTDCAATGALCTGDGRALSGAVAATVPNAVAANTPQTPLTASFEDMPAEHAGEAFRFEVAFSESFRLTYLTMRDSALTVTNGRVASVKRLDNPHDERQGLEANRRWRIAVEPDGNGDVAVALPATADCAAAGALCAGGRPLSNAVSATVLGPPGLSVADARAHENTDATVDFAVTLGRASSATVTVDYATSDGPSQGGAVAGDDYTHTTGTLTFAPGETGKTVSVPVIKDGHDEGDETFALTLSNASGGNAWLKDAEAVGTIENEDRMPQAWLARFGRTVAEQAIEAVEGRFAASRAAGVSVSLAGERIGSSGAAPEGDEARLMAVEEEEARDRLAAMKSWLQGTDTEDENRGVGARSRSVAPREILTGSSFALTGETKAGGTVSLWGRGAVSRFDGRERTSGGDLSLDGEVVSAMLGADWARERWTAGLMVSRSVGEGGYRGQGDGTVESRLTAFFPYGRYEATDRVTLWGIAGWGAGELTLTPDGQSPMRADMDLAMGAVGLRGVALAAPADGGVELAVKTDALAVRTTSDKTKGLEAAEADVTRLRLALEGTWRGLTLGAGTLAPTAEIGVRHDGGDAETGFGLDLGGGLSWSDPQSGLTAEFRGRGLLTHESKGFRDRGISGSFAWAPGRGSGRGPSLTLTQTLGGRATGGADALLGQRHLGGLAANPGSGSGAGENGDELANRRLELRMGYGFSVLEDRFTMTPELGLGLSNGQRVYTLGSQLGLAQGGRTALELQIEATRREAANDNAPPEHGAGFRMTARW